MHINILPSVISGRLRANPSKSHAQRAIALATLARGTSILTQPGRCSDVLSAVQIAEAMGAQVDHSEDSITINGGGSLRSDIWPCGESGLCLRMFSSIAALHQREIHLTARDTLLKRPVGISAEVFSALGVTCHDNKGFPPVTIKGPLKAGIVSVDGSFGSQFLTGLLIALPLVKDNTTLHVHELRSLPYIDLTIETMASFGVHVHHQDHQIFQIPGGQRYQPVQLQIQGDWSGSAFILVAAAITGEVVVTGLPHPSSQADGRIIEVLEQCGALVDISPEEVSVKKRALDAFAFDATHCPDLFPPLVALAAYCSGVSRISGLHRLATKESNRAHALISEFMTLGIRLWQDEDVLLVQGGKVQGGNVDAHGDHRIVMAVAVAALGSLDGVSVTDAQCVDKSYPAFFNDLAVLGGRVETDI